MIQRLLVANRGEIAVRIARAAREMGITALGVYSQADVDAYHLQFMDDARCIGPAPAPESYLNIAAIIAAAREMRADAVHPGYGFLSERAPFAQACIDDGFVWVGPPPSAMAAMGSKIEAKHRVRAFDVPTVPGYDGDDQSPARLKKEAAAIGVPLLIKASAGGGGRGMRVVESLDEFDEALAAARREALAAFGDDAVLLERYLRDPRHIEFQILADAHGTTLHLGERECSIQRRHQKVVEEAPSVALSPELRAAMGAAAVRAASSVGYVNAGTCEFMLDQDERFYFLEMNTRLQVEHPVTELVYGIDLVQWQLRIASGAQLTIDRDDVRPRGWAIESRIYAEDPANHMLPSTGRITRWSPPQGPGIRLDAGVTTGSEVSVYYDPMLAKLIVFGSNRPQAIARMQTALDDFTIDGVRANLPLLRWIVRDEWFRDGRTTTSFLAQRLDESIFAPREVPREAALFEIARRLRNGDVPWRAGGVGIPVWITSGASTFRVWATSLGNGRWQLSGDIEGELDPAGLTDSGVAFTTIPPPSAQSSGLAASVGAGDGRVTAPMPGKIVKIAVNVGDAVEEHALLLVLEAMKMEHRIESSFAGIVGNVLVKEGQLVTGGAPLVELRAPAKGS
ncbi:MAG TPA: acetyl-CoA carboxylase biotin carboxylase subunit [Candidatus Aquilonibacter sp.]